MSGHTVKQVARLSGVSVRTLHHYDEVGLLKPACVGGNGYRYYGREELLRLQQILFHRELGFSLEEIARVLGKRDCSVKLPKFEAYAAIWLTRDHREQAASQAKLATLLNGLPRVGRAHLRRWISGLREEERTARAWLGAHPRLDVQFEDLIDITTGSAGRICRFLKPYFGDVDPVAMERVILPRGPACQPGLDIETALVRAMA